MLIPLLLGIKDILALASYIFLINRVFQESLRKDKWRFLTLTVVSLFVSIGGYYLLYEDTEEAFAVLDFAATVLSLAAIPFLFRKCRFWRAVAVFFIYYATVDMFWSFLAGAFDASIIAESVFDIVISTLVIIAVFLGTNHKDVNIIAGAFKEIPVWLILSLLLFEWSSYYREFGISKTWNDIMYAVSSSLVFLSILYLVFRIFRLVYMQNMILQKLNDQLVYATQKEKSDETLRSFRHDFKNHSLVLNAMLESGNMTGAKAYLTDLTEEINGVMPKFSTGNEVVNSLLSIKSSAAAKDNIKISIEGSIPPQGIAPKDMCIIVGNLLDNAIEACRKLPKTVDRRITIQTGMEGNLLFISIRNPSSGSGTISADGLPKTTKSNSRVHGIGLKNVREIAKKYNGKLNVSTENSYFNADVLLELNTNGGNNK